MLTMRDDSGSALANAEAVLRSSHQRVTRLAILDDNFNPLPGLVFTGEAGYTLDGSVSQDASRQIRRTFQAQIANPNGIWTPSAEDSPFYWTKMVRLERGVRVGGTDYYASLGVFQIDSPEVDSGSEKLSISGSDRLDRATSSEFTEPTTYAAGSAVGDVIRDILEDAGVGSALWSVDDGGATLGADRSYEVGDERLQAAMTLATSFSLEVYADESGYMRVRPKVDPSTLPVAWTFQEGVDATHLGVSKKWSRDRFYNHVLVTNDTSDEDVPLLRAEAAVTDPASPLRVSGPMGDRLYKYVSAMITTQAQADSVAASLLWEHALIEEEIKLPHVPNPLLEADDAVRIVDVVTATDDVYAIQSLDMPIAGGSASLNVKKVRNLS